MQNVIAASAGKTGRRMDLCNQKTVKEIMDTFGLRFRKEFGQNFLTNPMIVSDIADGCADTPDISILEI